MKYYEDPILGKGRASDISGGTGGSGTAYIGGFAIGISGETISRLRYMPIESVTGNSITLQAGHAYKAYATSTAITLNTETVPDGQFGLEGHIEIYVAGTGYVVTGTNVVLANALEPNSVNNCTLRFHDGACIISVEDHIAGYIVVNGATSGDGSLYYGIATSTNDYVAFDASLNGTTIPLAGAVAEGEKHIVGNGYNETAITGAVDCGTSKFTVANLSLSNVSVNGGTMTMGDAYIPSGSTVAVSGGGLAVEKVSGNGVIDLGGSSVNVAAGTTASVSGCTFIGGSATNGAVFFAGGRVVLTACEITGNAGGNAIRAQGNAGVALSNCIVSGNAVEYDVYVNSGSVLSVNGGKINIIRTSGAVDVSGSAVISALTGNVTGSLFISSSAILDLTGNTNATPIAPGGGITFEAGGATVYPSAGSASAYEIDNITLKSLTNTNQIHRLSQPYNGKIKGCVISGYSAQFGGGIQLNNSSFTAESCSFVNNTAEAHGGAVYLNESATATFVSCTFSGNVNGQYNPGTVAIAGTTATRCTLSGCTFAATPVVQTVMVTSGGTVTLAGSNTIQRIMTYGASNGFVTISSGAIVDLTGNTNATPIAPGGGVVVDGGCTVITSAGASVSIAGGTYTKINNDGTTE